MKKRDRNAAAVEEALKGAMTAIQSRQPAAAERMTRDVLARDPRHPGALHLFGLSLLAQGRPREAVAPLEQAAGKAADAAVETHLAIALRQSGRSAQALEWLERAVTRQPPFVPAFHELGVLLFSLRRLGEAQAVLERGLALAPAAAELLVVLGGVYLDRADRANARVVFARALASTPGHSGALFGLGSAMMDDGEFAAAADRFRQALARDPDYAQARLSLGRCLLELGQPDEATACFRAAAQQGPQFFGKVLKTLVTAGRGQFWLKPSAAAATLRPSSKG
jgi:tetratricopeptide (TPR) repeat protein